MGAWGIGLMQHKEYLFQIAVVDWLYGRTRKGNKTYDGNCPMPGLFFTHHYAGRDAEDGFFLKQLGVRPGMGDLINWWNHTGDKLECGFLELKVDANMSGVQHKVKGICFQLGIKYEVAHNKEEVFGAYRKWGFTPLHYDMATPDYRTKQEKFKDIFDMYKPMEKKP